MGRAAARALGVRARVVASVAGMAADGAGAAMAAAAGMGAVGAGVTGTRALWGRASASSPT